MRSGPGFGQHRVLLVFPDPCRYAGPLPAWKRNRDGIRFGSDIRHSMYFEVDGCIAMDVEKCDLVFDRGAKA